MTHSIEGKNHIKGIIDPIYDLTISDIINEDGHFNRYLCT